MSHANLTLIPHREEEEEEEEEEGTRLPLRPDDELSIWLEELEERVESDLVKEVKEEEVEVEEVEEEGGE